MQPFFTSGAKNTSDVTFLIQGSAEYFQIFSTWYGRIHLICHDYEAYGKNAAPLKSSELKMMLLWLFPANMRDSNYSFFVQAESFGAFLC